MDDSIALTADELTWLSASTMIDNHYSLSGSPVFPSADKGAVSTDDEGDPVENSPLHPHRSLPTIPTGIPAGTPPSTRGSGSSSPSNFEGTGSPFQIHRQPITPPPTPPRRHLCPNYIPQADRSYTAPPSPTMSTVTLSSTGRTGTQTEWIYRRPKTSSPGTHAALSRHASNSASCTDSPSPSPSYSSLHHQNSKYRKHASSGSRPRPSSPVLLSSTSQLVDSVLPSPPLSSKTPTPGMQRHFANASVSSLQSSIRVSPLNNEKAHQRISPKPVSLERCPSTASTMTSASTTTAIWSALRIGKSGVSPGEHSRTLKAIPSRSQIVLDSSVSPTFIPPSSMSTVSLPSSISRLPNIQPRDHFVNGPRHGIDSPTIPPPLPQKDKDRSLTQQQAQPYSRRDKFVSSPPIPIVGLSATSRNQDVGPGVDVFGVSSSSPSSLSTPNNSSPIPPSHRPRPSTSPAASSPSPSGASNNTITMNMGLRRTSKTSGTATRDRDRTSSFTSDCSVATSTTTHTSFTTASSYLETPTSSAMSVPNVVRNGNSNVHEQLLNYDSTSRSSPYVHGSVNGKQHRQQTNSFINQGNGTVATVAARTQAYAQLTSRRRTSTSSSGTIIHGSEYGNPSNKSIVPMSTSYPSPPPLPSSPPPPPPLSQTHQHTSLPILQRVTNTSPFTHNSSHSRSRSTYAYAYMSTSPSQSQKLSQELSSSQCSSIPKAKSILTRTSSLSTKNSSACGGATKSVKFVEIPEIYYRSRCFDYDEFDYTAYRDDGNGSGNDEEDEGGENRDENVVAVGAIGEGQEGVVLRDCMGIDVEAIDMDINTYLGIGDEEKADGKDVRLSFRRMQEGFKVGSFWGKKEKVKEKEKTEKEDENKVNITTGEKEKEKEKEKSTGLGLKRFMGLTTRKAVPPPLTLNISSPLPLTSTTTQKTPSINLETKSKKDIPSSPGPKPTISGPYTLGSYLQPPPPPPPRSTTGIGNSPLPSPSSSITQHSFSSHTIPGSPSNTSLNRMNSSSRRNYSYSHRHRSHGSRSHSTSSSTRRPPPPPPPPTIANGFDSNTERPVGPNIAGTRPKGIIGLGHRYEPEMDMEMNMDISISSQSHSLHSQSQSQPHLHPQYLHSIIPIGKSPSYESFRSAKSFGTTQSIRSVKSASGNSIRSIKAWMNKVVGTGTGSGSGSGSVNGGTEAD